VVGEPDAALDVEAAVELEEPPEAAESEMEMMARVWGKSAPFRERGWDPAEGSPHVWWPGKLAGSQPNTFPSIGPPSDGSS
jgi:hypothetical protein